VFSDLSLSLSLSVPVCLVCLVCVPGSLWSLPFLVWRGLGWVSMGLVVVWSGLPGGDAKQGSGRLKCPWTRVDWATILHQEALRGCATSYSYRTLQYSPVQYSAVQYSAVLVDSPVCYAMLCYAMLCYARPGQARPGRAVPCYASFGWPAAPPFFISPPSRHLPSLLTSVGRLRGRSSNRGSHYVVLFRPGEGLRLAYH
jgi:hypothetical protein